MQDMYSDTESHTENDLVRFAQKAVHEAPESRAARIADAQRALNNHRLMLNAEVLASRIVADSLHQAHCDM